MPALSTRGAASAKGFGLTGFVPALPDPYFNNVTMLLPGNGTNGAQNNTFLDSSSNNFSITRNGDTTQGTFSPFSQTGWSNYFPGSAAVGPGEPYLLIPFNSALSFGTGSFTYECWFFNYLSYTSNAGFIDLGDANAAGSFAVFMNGGDFIVRIGGLGNDLSFVASSIARNTWYHLAVVRNGSTLTIYINGVAQASGTRSQNVTQGSPYIGSIRPDYSIKLQGNLSNVRIVKGTAVYTSNFTPPTAPLTAISGTSLLTCQSNRFVDNSSNAFALTISNTPSVQAFSPFNPTAPYDPATNGGSGYFDGSGDFLSTPSITVGSNNFTFECWVYPSTSQSGNPRIFEIGGDNNDYFLLQYTASTTTLILALGTGGGGTTVCSTTISFAAAAWTHIAVVREGTGANQVKMYINGVNVSTGTSSASIPGAPAYVGGISWASPFHWNGYISSARLVVGTAVYTANFTPPTAPLAAITNTQLLLNFTNAGIIDATGKNDLVTVGNAQISTAQSKFGGGSMAFDGSGDWLTGPNTPGLYIGSGDFTVEGWLYLNATGSQKGIVSQFNAGGAGPGWTLYIKSSNVLEFYGGNGTVTVTGTTAISATTWTHFAVVRSGSTITIYVNGTAGGSATNSSFSDETSGLIYVGGRADNASLSLNGYIDDLRITKGVARYTGNFTPPTKAFPTK